MEVGSGAQPFRDPPHLSHDVDTPPVFKHTTQVLSEVRRDVLHKLHHNPESLTEADLRGLKLSVLSKGLGSFSPNTTLDTYIRWLNIQSISATNSINSQWRSVIDCWAAALRRRGFHRAELLLKIDRVNTLNENSGRHTHRSRKLPNFQDLDLAWYRSRSAESSTTSAATSSPTRKILPIGPTNMIVSFHSPEGPDKTVKQYCKFCNKTGHLEMNCPGKSQGTFVANSYICNRCRHLVNDCPTNEDPSFDTAPDNCYVCKYCKARADHFFIFCPKNPDPDSIYRRRFAKGLIKEGQKRGRDESTSFERPAKFAHISGTSKRSKLPRDEGRLMDDEWDEDFTLPIGSSSKGDDIQDNHPQFPAWLDKTNQTAVNFLSNSTFERARIDREASHGVQFSGNEDEIMLDDVSPPNIMITTFDSDNTDWRNFTKQICPVDFHHYSPLESKHDEQQQVLKPHRPPSYEELICNLFKNHPSQLRSNPQQRLTALDMWHISDKRNDVELFKAVRLELCRMDVTGDENIKNRMKQKTLNDLIEKSKFDWAEDASDAAAADYAGKFLRQMSLDAVIQSAHAHWQKEANELQPEPKNGHHLQDELEHCDDEISDTDAFMAEAIRAEGHRQWGNDSQRSEFISKESTSPPRHLNQQKMKQQSVIRKMQASKSLVHDYDAGKITWANMTAVERRRYNRQKKLQMYDMGDLNWTDLTEGDQMRYNEQNLYSESLDSESESETDLVKLISPLTHSRHMRSMGNDLLLSQDIESGKIKWKDLTMGQKARYQEHKSLEQHKSGEKLWEELTLRERKKYNKRIAHEEFARDLHYKSKFVSSSEKVETEIGSSKSRPTSGLELL